MDRVRDKALGRFLDRGALKRWSDLARAAEQMDLSELRALHARAAGLRQRVDRALRVAEDRLALPRVGSSAIQKPLHSDWAWRPPAWRHRMPEPGAAGIETRAELGEALTLFHDCRISELSFRQVRNRRAEDLAPFGLRLDVFRFDGSFLSLALDLPPEGLRDLSRHHILRADVTVETETPLEVFLRMNVRHGPNVEQVVRELPMDAPAMTAEFDLDYTGLGERTATGAWLDLIFEGPEMNQITLRDLTLSRRPRAEF
ncbi:hypothetical protein DXV76_04175 [Rhodobacteraceae bacterium CCMM004]|nr:hypothetical protein DXV76_04175 [Rhodobacteraceae bacterium CCMM004]